MAMKPLTGRTVWLATPSCYAGWPANRARTALGLILALMVSMTIQLHRPLPPGARAQALALIDRGESDLTLYRAVVENVRHGGDYYMATAHELRARPGYPLRPFVTFRLPTLARVQAALPDLGVYALQLALAALVAIAWSVRLAGFLPQRASRVVAGLLMAGGLIVSVQYDLGPSHEVWAALLIALSLAAWHRERWVAAVAVATMAMLVRETAALYVLVMAGFALMGGRWREVGGWITGLGLAALAVTAHALAVWHVTGPLDAVSDGWTGFNGPWFYAMTVKHATVLEVFPFELVAPLVALALFGWTVPRDAVALRMAVVLGAYGMLIATLARLDNFYWGLMIAPMLLVGLVFVPDGLRDLARAALDKRRIVVTRPQA